MVEHRILTDDYDEEHDRQYEDCTGVAARWCPIHGDCTCDPDEDGADSGQARPRARQTAAKTAVGFASEASLPSLRWSRVPAPRYFTCPPRSARPCGCGAKEATNSTPPHPGPE